MLNEPQDETSSQSETGEGGDGSGAGVDDIAGGDTGGGDENARSNPSGERGDSLAGSGAPVADYGNSEITVTRQDQEAIERVSILLINEINFKKKKL